MISKTNRKGDDLALGDLELAEDTITLEGVMLPELGPLDGRLLALDVGGLLVDMARVLAARRA